MVTTIQVSEKTKSILEMQKTQKEKTYDQVIQKLLQNQQKKSLFGAYPQLEWTKKDRTLSKHEARN